MPDIPAVNNLVNILASLKLINVACRSINKNWVLVFGYNLLYTKNVYFSTANKKADTDLQKNCRYGSAWACSGTTGKKQNAEDYQEKLIARFTGRFFSQKYNNKSGQNYIVDGRCLLDKRLKIKNFFIIAVLGIRFFETQPV